PTSFDTQTSFKRPGWIVHSAVNHSAVVCAGVEAWTWMTLEHTRGQSARGNGSRRREAADPRADDGDLDGFHAGLVSGRHPTIVVRSLDFPVDNNHHIMTTPASALIERIGTRRANIGVIGLGYVGLPLAVEFAKAGFHVTGFDVDSSKTNQINV